MNAWLTASRVAVCTGCGPYPGEPPFSPETAYPEYPFDPATCGRAPNPAYAGVRRALQRLGLDAPHFGRPEWNPLGDIVRPGDTVVLKPNLVREFRETQAGHGDCLVTHGSLIRAAADYVYIALRGRGRIIVADAPHSDADFDALRRITGLDALCDFYRQAGGVDFDVRDLRPERAHKIDGVIVGHSPLPGDPAGYVRVDLGRHSAFAELGHLCGRLYGAEYDRGELRAHHREGVHEYLIAGTVLAADCVVSLPKLKTHKKTGLTVNMKNLVGINGNKNWLPHYREGTPAEGGDQYADNGINRRLERRLVTGFKRVFPRLGPLRPWVGGPLARLGKRVFGDTNNGVIRSGNWYGNDTAWRMVVDLNRILFYAGADGRLHARARRRFFSIVDGVVAGEGDGPLNPTPRAAGVVLAGANPVAVDLVCARLMGFDYRRLPVLDRALRPHALPLANFAAEDVAVCADEARFDRCLGDFVGPALAFRPHVGWAGYVELDASPAEPVAEDARP